MSLKGYEEEVGLLRLWIAFSRCWLVLYRVYFANAKIRVYCTRKYLGTCDSW